MEYRSLGRLKVKALGFGAMRLPHEGGDTSKIKEKEATTMVHYAINNGIDYIDTAYPYHRKEGEPFLGRALKDGYREKVTLATKMPTWLIEKKEDMDHYFKEQLTRLKTQWVDIYLLHSLNKKKWDNLLGLDVLAWLEKKREEGFIGEFGFSFHDSLPIFKEILDSYPWPICQIQYNYIDQEFQAGKAGLKMATKKGTSVIIMEPLRGGTLASLPKELLAILNRGEKKKTPAHWALQWLWDQEEIPLVLSGMSTLQQLKENIKSAEESAPNSLSKADRENFQELIEAYQGLAPTGCTGCNYCQPCPEGIMIPYMLELYNESHIFKNYGEKKNSYHSFPKSSRSFSCTQCEVCLEKCPQNLPIPKLMKKVAIYFQDDGKE